jgi:hypothetical protein
MYWNPNRSHDRENLRRAIDQSYRDMEFARDTRTKILDMYVGNRYGKRRVSEYRKQIMNLTYQAVSIYVSWLVAENPVPRAKTRYVELMPEAKKFEVNLANVARMINLTDSLRDAVLEAVIKGPGICKVALGSSEFVRLDNDSFSDPGLPFVASIGLDDWVHDMSAKNRRRCRWMGDYYEVGEDALMADKMFNAKQRDRLLNQIRRNEDTGKRASAISVNRNDYDLFCRSAKLIDIWIPREQKVYTFDANLEYPPLNVVDYEGNSEGPYKFLCFDEVPDNTIPISPMENLIELAEGTNSLLRKNLQKARSLKEVMGFEANSATDAQAVKDADDGEYVQIARAEGIAPLKVGGPDQNVFSFNLSLLEQYNRMGGNIMTLGGLGAQTSTLGQEELLNQQVGALMRKLQQRVIKFASEVFGELGWLLWNDQVGYRASVSLEEFGLPNTHIDASWMPGERQGRLENYVIEVEPNSMTYQSPQQKMMVIDDILLNKALPLMQTPMGQESGMTIDPKDYIQVASDLHNIPELRRIIKFTGQRLPDPPSPNRTQKTKPNGGTYIHKSEGSGQKDPNQQIMKMMQSANANNDQ